MPLVAAVHELPASPPVPHQSPARAGQALRRRVGSTPMELQFPAALAAQPEARWLLGTVVPFSILAISFPFPSPPGVDARVLHQNPSPR